MVRDREVLGSSLRSSPDWLGCLAPRWPPACPETAVELCCLARCIAPSHIRVFRDEEMCSRSNRALRISQLVFGPSDIPQILTMSGQEHARDGLRRIYKQPLSSLTFSSHQQQASSTRTLKPLRQVFSQESNSHHKPSFLSTAFTQAQTVGIIQHLSTPVHHS